MSKIQPGEEWAATTPNDTGYFRPGTGNINPALKSGDTVRPSGGDPTPPIFRKK